MWYYSGESVVLVIGALSGCMGGFCYGMRLSRCSRISIFCGLCKCERDVPENVEETVIDNNNLDTENVI